MIVKQKRLKFIVGAQSFSSFDLAEFLLRYRMSEIIR